MRAGRQRGVVCLRQRRNRERVECFGGGESVHLKNGLSTVHVDNPLVETAGLTVVRASPEFEDVTTWTLERDEAIYGLCEVVSRNTCRG